jgi:aerobic carbon-monoxide dehydrogenase medium subunit
VVDAMTAVAFAWHRPKAIDEAVDALATHGRDAALLAGGGSLAILLNERAVRPAHVIDLNQIGELAGIRDEGESVWIGAMTRVFEVESSELLRDRLPLLPACARTVADPSLRHRVTVGGGLGYADSSGSLPTALLALDCTVHASGPRGARDIPIDELFVAAHETSLGPDELITGVTVPVPPTKAGTAWLDLDRRHLAYSLVSAAAVVEPGDGRIRRARVAMAGIAPTPRRLRAVERALDSTDEAGVRRATARAVEDADPIGDIHASVEYRRRMAVEFSARAVLEAISRW